MFASLHAQTLKVARLLSCESLSLSETYLLVVLGETQRLRSIDIHRLCRTPAVARENRPGHCGTLPEQSARDEMVAREVRGSCRKPGTPQQGRRTPLGAPTNAELILIPTSASLNADGGTSRYYIGVFIVCTSTIFG